MTHRYNNLHHHQERHEQKKQRQRQRQRATMMVGEGGDRSPMKRRRTILNHQHQLFLVTFLLITITRIQTALAQQQQSEQRQQQQQQETQTFSSSSAYIDSLLSVDPSSDVNNSSSSNNNSNNNNALITAPTTTTINNQDNSGPSQSTLFDGPQPAPASPLLPPLNQPQQQQPAKNKTTLHIATLFDMSSFPGWPSHILNFTIGLINNKTDGWHDDVLLDGSVLEWSIHNSGCDPDTAVRSYLGMMRNGGNSMYNMQNGFRPNAIFGCRCSGASMAVSRLCAIENIPILSPASTSVKLSVKEEYPTFSRLVGPDNHMGELGALISLLREFGWDRISVINTDTQFTKDIAVELSDAWKGTHDDNPDDPFVGEIAYSDTIKLNKTNTQLVDYESARRVLANVPVDKQAINSRVIVLFAHVQHAYPVLKLAREMGFQPDTIWVGTSSWIGRDPLDGDFSWMPPIPGYLGVGPYRNFSSPTYLDFLHRLQAYERANFIQPMTQKLPDFIADRFVDGPLALAKAFEVVPPELRFDGQAISEALRQIQFDGLSGPIALRENGDFKDPRYMVLTMSSRGEGWLEVGYATPSQAVVAMDQVCYAEVGCVSEIPDDTYPADKEPFISEAPVWIWIVVALLIVISLAFYRQRQKSIDVTTKLDKITKDLEQLENNDDAVKEKKGRLYKEIATLLNEPTPAHWSRTAAAQRQKVVEVTPIEEEYWNVLTKLRETMTEGETCHLSHLSRIQNEGIWSYYVFRKNQLANKYGVDLNSLQSPTTPTPDGDKSSQQLAPGVRSSRAVNTDKWEASVWHGTSSLNPDVIYRDQQDGFMMQLSQQGHWGRGIYFSERSGYSDPYAFKPLTEFHDSNQQDRELFLVKLLVGEAIYLDRSEGEWMAEACRALVTPPDNPNFNGYKFDTVTGTVEDEARTKIYVVYENGRAYPEYLVRYYKGDRDPRRTPFESWEEVLEEKENQEREEPRESAASVAFRQLQSKFLEQSGVESSRYVSPLGDTDEEDDANSENSEVEAKGIWQYQDDNDNWINYLNGHQIQLETAYQQDNAGVTTIETFPWTYAVDFSVNLQTNLDHPERKTRKIRRIHIDHLDPSHRQPRSSSSFRFSSRHTSASRRRLMHPEWSEVSGILEEGEMEESMTNHTNGGGGGGGGREDAQEEQEETKEEIEPDDDGPYCGSATTGATVATMSVTTAGASSSLADANPGSSNTSSPPALAPTYVLPEATEEPFVVGPPSVDGLSSAHQAEAAAVDERYRLGVQQQNAADAAAGTDIANLRNVMTDEQAASIASSLHSFYPSVRSVTTDSMSSLYPSVRDIANAGSSGLGEHQRTRAHHHHNGSSSRLSSSNTSGSRPSSTVPPMTCVDGGSIIQASDSLPHSLSPDSNGIASSHHSGGTGATDSMPTISLPTPSIIRRVSAREGDEGDEKP